MRKLFQNFRKSESGATLVEYGVALILAIILGGGALSVLAEGTGANMDVACDSLVADATQQAATVTACAG
jgi:Flp pilus assembly pilin Flp